MSKINIVLAAAIGTASGIVAGILFAPDKGSQTRKKISDSNDIYLQDLKKDVEVIRRNLRKKKEKIRKELEELGDDTKRKGNDMLKKAKKITSYEEWTKDELYERAKALDIEGRSAMNKDELIEALRNN